MSLIVRNSQRLIGLTGGIGTGKSTVSRYLQEKYQVPIFDADIYAREAVQVDSPVLRQISDRYGTAILRSDGTLNRQQLGEIIFTNTSEKQWLESQIHPYVRSRFEEAIAACVASTIVLDIPLLLEAKMTDLVTEIWVVYCHQQAQIKRLMKRDKISEEQALKRINSQLPMSDKIKAADIILDNSGTLENLFPQIEQACLGAKIKKSLN